MDRNEDRLDEGKQALGDMADTLKAGGADVAAQARGAAEDVSSAAGEAAGIARDAGAKVARRARAAAAAADVAFADARETAAEELSEGISLLEDLKARAEDYVRIEPMKTVGIAVGAGVLLGLFLRGRRR